MGRSQQFWWHIDVRMTAVAPPSSAATRNWVLAVLCAVFAAGL